MADLGPGTMPRGKYPESPAPAGSHALISRTPPPGGMLHANLGLPRPPPRNFQPPLPRFPSRLSPRRMSGTTVGRKKQHRHSFHALALVLSNAARKISGISRAKEFPSPTPSPSQLSERRSRVFRHGCRSESRRLGRIQPPPSNFGATAKEKNNIVIPEFSAWLTLVLEQCRAENIRNLPRERAPTPLFPERRPREACSMPISGCHDLPLATFNLPSRVFRHGCRRAECLERRWGGFFHTHSRACERIPLRHRSNPQRKKQHRHSGIFRVADLGPGTMPRGKYPESPAPAGSHALISRTPPPGGMLHANLGLPRPPPRNFQPPLPRFPSRLSPRRMSGTTVGRILSHPLQSV